MDQPAVELLRDQSAAWRLLRATNSPLILSFLGGFFVTANRGATPAHIVASALEDHLFALVDGDERYPRPPTQYLEEWAAPEAGYLRRFYPPGHDEIHYEVTPAFEKAYAWVDSLQARSFVGTESRLHTVVDLLRQIVHGTDADPTSRLAELQRRRDLIDAEIAAVEAGQPPILDDVKVRDRYQQVATTARALLSDFREVEENFRHLDRAAREKIAGWDGTKGDLLAELVGSRSDITGSDQGRSFQAFHDFLLSGSQQEELSTLLSRATDLLGPDADQRLRTIHHDWAEAAERTQHTVRQLSEQLRRFLDDQVWLENRRVLDLVRGIEAAALQVRDAPPEWGIEIDLPGLPIVLPFERPLYEPPTTADVVSLIPPVGDDPLDDEALFTQRFVNAARLAELVRGVLPPRSSMQLEDIVDLYPLEQGAAEIVGYLSISDDELSVELDDGDVTVLDYPDEHDEQRWRRARLPKVTVRRR
ncbi:MAG: DUF3375 domain-containing protein [Arachnia propionica]|uniref:DUF3375 domain-containing protein n=1 Tax=Arachnia propionica TaxID=1750 RepID=UPI00270365EA|nr:DUF3375 domain-containing protein [Arachnia propionica]